MGLSKMSKQCEKCKHKDDCDEKRMAACAVANCEPMMANSAAELIQPIMQPMAVKHNYRDIKVAEGMTITIDLEDFKKEIARELYKDLDAFRGLNYGA